MAAATAKKYDPFTVRRCVRISDVANGGIVIFASKSMTEATPEDRYHPMVDIQTGECACDCPDFTYRKAKLHPTVNSPESDRCKHLNRAVSNLTRKGIL